MAHQQYNHQYPPPVQTQNLHQYQQQQQQQQQQQGAYSPPSYQQSPTMGSGIPPAKRQRLSPNPPSPAPYQSPFAASPYPQSQPQSPYAASPQYPGHLSVPASPAAQQPPPFHHPQSYQHPNGALQPPAPSQGSMPPPKMPYSKAQDNSELEKANARDLDVNTLSDVLSGGIVDLRAEEDLLLHNYGNRNQGASFNSQHSGSTATPGGSFNSSQQAGHGAYQGTGPLSHTVTKEQQEAELLRKHEQAARILNDSSQHPLTDPFVAANVLRHRIAKRAYDTGISVNVDGLFDKIPEKAPRDVERRTRDGASGEQVIGLEAASLLNQNAPLVDIISLLSLAAEERIRTLVEEAYALSQGRQHTSHGVIPPQMLDIAVVEKDAEAKMLPPVNILKTPWEVSDTATSPSATAHKQPPNAARLPTPPSEAPPTPKPTYQNANHVAAALKRKISEDEQYEKERLAKRQKRTQGTSATPVETPIVALPVPDRMTKKDKDALKKQNQTDEVMHRKANETANIALGFGKKKKYSWMTGGGGGPASGASTPLPSAPAGSSGIQTPSGPTTEKALMGRRRGFGANIENTEIGEKIQIRDLVHVLEHDGREKKTLSLMLVRLKNTEKDEKRADYDRRLPPAAGR